MEIANISSSPSHYSELEDHISFLYKPVGVRALLEGEVKLHLHVELQWLYWLTEDAEYVVGRVGGAILMAAFALFLILSLHRYFKWCSDQFSVSRDWILLFVDGNFQMAIIEFLVCFNYCILINM